MDKMRCAAIIPSVIPGNMLNTCVSTMIDGGRFDGDIYVVSFTNLCGRITELGKNVKFINTKTKDPDSVDTSIYKAFSAFDKQYDLMIYSHSDVIFHKLWWDKLQESWSYVDKNKVWGIGIPYNAEHAGAIRKEHKLGLGIDIYNPLHGSKFSAAHSFSYQYYADTVNKYGGNTYLALEHLLFYEGVLRHKWSLIANNDNFIDHLFGVDTAIVPGFNMYCGETYSIWHKLFGTSLDHFVAAWFGLTLNIHKTEILNSINAGDYKSIDYIFDEGLEVIRNPDCPKCLAKHADMRHCRALNRPRDTHTTY